jgi:integrase-like protein
VTILLQRLHDELVRRHYATTTRESYLKILKAFQRHIGKRLDHVGPNDLRRYQVYLLQDRRLAVGTVVAQLAALRFFYLRVLKRRHMKEDLPYPKRLRRLPIILYDGLSPPLAAPLAGGAQSARATTRTDARGAPPVPALQKTRGVVSRPAVEVADILHAQGDTFIEQHPWTFTGRKTYTRQELDLAGATEHLRDPA